MLHPERVLEGACCMMPLGTVADELPKRGSTVTPPVIEELRQYLDFLLVRQHYELAY